MLRIICLTVTMFIKADMHTILPVTTTTKSNKFNYTPAASPINASQALTNIKKETAKIENLKKATTSKEKKTVRTKRGLDLINKTNTSEQKNNNDSKNIKNKISGGKKQKHEHQKNKALEKSILTEKCSKNIHTPNKDPQKITIVNSITPEKTTYSHWSGTYQPDFTITVDGTKINMNSQESIEIHQQKITVKYDAQFPANHSSQDEFIIDIAQNTDTITLDFDWHAKPRVKINQTSSIPK